MNGRQDLDLLHHCLLSDDPHETPLKYLQKADDSCNTTVVHASVLNILDFCIKYATAMSAIRKKFSDPLRLEGEVEEDGALSSTIEI